MAAQGGATTRELMAHAGHSTPRAALIYQHVAEEGNLAIAATLDMLSGRGLQTQPVIADSGAEMIVRREVPGTWH